MDISFCGRSQTRQRWINISLSISATPTRHGFTTISFTFRPKTEHQDLKSLYYFIHKTKQKSIIIFPAAQWLQNRRHPNWNSSPTLLQLPLFLWSHHSPLSDLGVKFDPCLSFENHVTSICKSSFFHFRNISKLRPSLSLRPFKSFSLCRTALPGSSTHRPRPPLAARLLFTSMWSTKSPAHHHLPH